MSRTTSMRHADYRIASKLPSKHPALVAYFSEERALELIEEYENRDFSTGTFSTFMNNSRLELDDAFLAENIKLFTANSNPDSETLHNFKSYLEYLSWNIRFDKYVDAELLSLYTVNEFLNNPANEKLTYGEYLDAHWDEDYESAIELKFTVYPNTKELIKKFERRSSLALHDELTKAEQKFIEHLTFDDIKYLTDLPVNSLTSKVDKGSRHLKLLLSYKDSQGSKDREVSVIEAKTLVLNIFMKKISSMPLPHKYDVPALYANVSELLKEMTFKSAVGRLKPPEIYTVDIEPVLSFIFKNLDDFSLQHVMGIILSLSSKPTVTRSGSINDYVKLLNTVVTEKEPHDAIASLQLIADVVIRSENQRPTMNEWQKAYESDLLDGTLPQEIFTALATAEKKFAPTGIHTYVKKLLS